MAASGTTSNETNARYSNVYDTSTTPKSLEIKRINGGAQEPVSNVNPPKKLSQSIKEGQIKMFATINAANTILEKLPSFIDAGYDIISANQFSFSASPLGLLIKLLYLFGVTDKQIVDWLVDFMVNVLPYAEMGLKAALLANIKEIVSCSADPRIPKRLRKKIGSYYYETGISAESDERGLIIPVDSIDPKGILGKSPYNTESMLYYFGVMSGKVMQNKLLEENLNDFVASAKLPVYKLVRADDFNAFLWFVIHKGRFSSPSNVVINKEDGTIIVNNDTYNIDKTKGGDTILSKMVVNPVYPGEGVKKDKMSLGQTFTVDSSPNIISMCFHKDVGYEEDGSEYTTSDTLLPVSNDWVSVNWYADRRNYYARNLGLTDKFGTDFNSRDFSNERGICNLQYLTPIENGNYVGETTQNLKFTILPKPYVVLDLDYIGRILFNEEGEADSNGRFSLPTDKLTSSGTAYVRNENLKISSENLIDYVNANAAELESEWKTVYDSVAGGDVSVLRNKNSMTLNVLAQIISKATIIKDNMDVIDERAKVLSVIVEEQNKRIKEELRESGQDELIFNVGEDVDDCVLHVNVSNGSYYLSDSQGNKNKDFTKHLVECYNGLTVYEFNYDYIMSQRLFNPATVCYQLLSNISNGADRSTFTVGINLNKDDNDYTFGYSSQRITEIVKNIINSDDEELSDCFYKFSNADFAAMLEESERKRFNRLAYTNNFGNVNLTEANAILSTLSMDMSREEWTLILNRAIETTMASVVNENNVALQDEGTVRLDFATNMLSQLAAILIDSILSPKVLLLIAVNKALVGNSTRTINAEDLLNAMKGVVVGLVREIRDLVLQKLLDYLLSLLMPIVAELAAKIELEQYQSYMALLRSLLSLISDTASIGMEITSTIKTILNKYGAHNSKRSDIDLPTVLDNVTYADITPEDAANNENNNEPSIC